MEQVAVITSAELSSLNDAIERLGDQLTAQNNRVREIEEVFSCKFDQIAKDHEKQLDLRIERLHQQYAKLQYFADEHHKLFIEEGMISRQMQDCCSEKDSSTALMQKTLDESINRLAESDTEKKKLAERLDEAHKRLAESDAESKRLRTELENSRLEFQTSRKLAASTKLRQLKELKELDVTEEIIALISHLQEDTSARVGHIRKQNSMCSNAEDAQEKGEGNKLDGTDSGSPDYLQRLKKIYKPLLEKLEARKVAAFMFQHDALTVKELQSVQNSHKTHYEASEELLKVILEVKEQHVYDCFLEALRDTEQQHIWSWLSYDDYDIDCEHVQLIQKHYSFIVDSMDAQHSGLITELYSRGVIDERDKGDIEVETSSLPRNEKLLSYLGRKPKEIFILFLDAMCKTGQQFIVKKLREDAESLDLRESKSPTLKHVIPSDGRRVAGLTFINTELFVLRYPSEEEIQVYETATFTQQRTVRVAGLSDDAWPWCKTLTSCDVNNCLFVCDGYNVYKVDLATDNAINWQVNGEPSGLSVNDARHVIVTCYYYNGIREYEQTGQLIRTIKLQEYVTDPWHAVQMTDSQFIVSHHRPVNGVSLIDTRGRVIATYRNSLSTKRLHGPRQLIVGKNGSVLVVDCDNNRLVVLDASLKNARELALPIDGGLNRPCCLFYNESLSQLFVSDQRVIICDNISFE